MTYKNEYLQDITKGLKLISDLQEISSDKSLIDKKIKELNKLIRKDYIELKFQQDLLCLYNKLEETVNSPILANKKVIAVAGRRNVGKSEFLNSLLEFNNLPTDIKATTAIPTYVCSSDEEKIIAYNSYGSQAEIDQEALEAITCNFDNRYDISFTQILRKIIVQVKEFKYGNLAFLDTIGYGKDSFSKNRAAINLNNNEIQKADYLIWVLDIEDEQLLEEDIEYINQLNFSGAVFVLFNKAENKDAVELKKIINRAKSSLCNLKNSVIGVSAYSSVVEKEISSNKLSEFLAKINQKDNQLNLTNQFRDLFVEIKDQHTEKLKYAENKLSKLEKIIKEEELKQKEYIKRVLKNIKKEIKIEKELLEQVKGLMERIIELVKAILVEVEISFFDHQERGYKLLEAIKNEEFKLAQRLIDLGVDLEVKNNQGQTPLALAVKKDAHGLKKKLLVAGAELIYQGEEIIEDPIPGEGSKENPYIISALSGLEKIGSKDYPLAAHYKLGRDIDASKTKQKEYNNGQGWQPIGNSEELNNYQAFKGSFDGSGYTIKNLYFNRSKESQVGLFRVVGPGGVIKNLELADVEFFGKVEVGGIAGRVRLGEIIDCSCSGSIKGNKKLGQIVGKNEGGQIKSVSARGRVEGNIDIGGLIGYNLYYGLLKDSFSLSKVIGDKKVGGAVGCNDQGGQIKSSYAEGDVSGGAIVGGLSGYNYGSIEKSFASGDIKGTYQLGGLVGKSESKFGFGRAEIIDSYALGHVKGKKLLGGLVGVNKELISKSYASGKLEGDEVIGGLVGYNSGQIEQSYVRRKIISNAEKNNLVGKNDEGKVIDSYWKKEYND